MRRVARKIFDFLKMLALLGLLAVASAWLAKQSEVSFVGEARVVDGDSLFIRGEEIRLLGIDAPEFRQTCSEAGAGTTFECGKDALRFLRTITRGQDLECVGSERDKYDRLLAVCYSDGTDVNREMVLQGWAVSFGDYESEEGIAQREKRGMWAGSFDAPSRWRREAHEAHAVNWLNSLSFW